MKKIIFILLLCAAFAKSSNGQTSIYITAAAETLYYACGTPPPAFEEFNLYADISGYNLNDTFLIKTFFGDGTFSTYYEPYIFIGVGKAWTVVSHTWLNYGTYDMTFIIQGPDGNSDTLFVPAAMIVTDSCAQIVPRVFIDNNADCIYDAGDSLVYGASINFFHGLANYHTVNPSQYFPFPAPAGINYTAYVNLSSLLSTGYTLSCPASGFINFFHNGPDTIDFAITCNSDFDLAASANSATFKIGNSAIISTGVSNISCLPVPSGTYSVTLDPLLSFVVALNAPSSNVGNTYNWLFTNLGSTWSWYAPYWFPSMSQPLTNMMYANMDPSVQVGDTLCYTMSVSPTAGDINPANNTVTICSVVRSAWDPNFKAVSPAGEGINGLIPQNTLLTYTIGFQNTGNDTAKNVYVMDTLDNNVDINTLQILYTTHPVQFFIIDGHILKFQFDNINLPDSGANSLLSHGFISYKIKCLPNRPDGTQILNAAAIYFDYNPAVITNTVLNTIDIALGLNENNNATAFEIYPNPATDEITIISGKHAADTGKEEIKILDVTGRVLLQTTMPTNSQLQTKLSVASFAPGIYFVKVGEDIRKLVVRGK